MLGKKKKRNNKPDSDDEDVPVDTSNDDEMDIDNVAEIRAIAKKMLRKKDRSKILYSTYNRYAFSDLDNAPQWFAEDENQHNRPSKPVTKEEMDTERLMLKQVNDRMPKKVLQAISRKKNKLARRMEKVKKKAQVISNQEEINEISKVKQIEKMYKRELNRSKEKKKYVVARSNKIRTGKPARNVKYVDKRLKKDKRSMKAIEKKKKK
jgi:AdoMet-dependent rRNA methyltransferase SPB1